MTLRLACTAFDSLVPVCNLLQALRSCQLIEVRLKFIVNDTLIGVVES